MPGEMAAQVTEKQFSELKSKKKRVLVFMGTVGVKRHSLPETIESKRTRERGK